MKRLLVYSHDTYGLGNIRRMLGICQHLLEVLPELSILLVTGSPVIHSLRLPALLDYIKLPCLTRVGRGEYTTKYLSAGLNEAIRLRSDLILATVTNFEPDLLLVDKKPLGVKRELAATLDYLQAQRPHTRRVLILRDILDSPEMIISNWERNGHYEAIERFYDLVLVLGVQKIFDPVKEYRFPPSVVEKTAFCGYVRSDAQPIDREDMRRILGVSSREKLVLVTAGGGQDGYQIIESYLSGLESLPVKMKLKSLVICGPEMTKPQKTMLKQKAATDSNVIFYEFTGDMMGLMASADVVVAMGGYNTICEIISLNKHAIIIPRIHPTEEQLMRAERLSSLGYFKAIHPDKLTPELLMLTLMESLESDCHEISVPELDLNALSVVSEKVESLLYGHDNPRP